jgi:hypothetical protein
MMDYYMKFSPFVSVLTNAVVFSAGIPGFSREYAGQLQVRQEAKAIINSSKNIARTLEDINCLSMVTVCKKNIKNLYQITQFFKKPYIWLKFFNLMGGKACEKILNINNI